MRPVDVNHIDESVIYTELEAGAGAGIFQVGARGTVHVS